MSKRSMLGGGGGRGEREIQLLHVFWLYRLWECQHLGPRWEIPDERGFVHGEPWVLLRHWGKMSHGITHKPSAVFQDFDGLEQ